MENKVRMCSSDWLWWSASVLLASFTTFFRFVISFSQRGKKEWGRSLIATAMTKNKRTWWSRLAKTCFTSILIDSFWEGNGARRYTVVEYRGFQFNWTAKHVWVWIWQRGPGDVLKVSFWIFQFCHHLGKSDRIKPTAELHIEIFVLCTATARNM